MKISILCVGKIKEKYLNSMIDEYRKRLSKYCDLNIYEVKDVVLKDNSVKGVEKVLDEEEKLLNKYLKADAYKVCLAIEGKQLTSEQFAQDLEGVFNKVSHIQFIIGGSYGLKESIKNQCDLKLSFSKMTFTHQMMRGILLEQIYRCYKINNNESYHK